MPWVIVEIDGRYCVHKETEDGEAGERVACHDTRAQAEAQMRALYASEDKATDLAVTIGAEVKALGDGKVGGYLVLYGDADNPDLSEMRDWFAPDTDYGLEDGHGKSIVLYHHGLDPVIGRRTLAHGSLKADDAGVWLEAQLAMRDEYERAIYQLAKAGKLGMSSGTAPHLVEREEQENGTHKITRWPLGIDASLTPIPAEPRTKVLPLKSYIDLAVDYVKALAPKGDATKASPEAGDVDTTGNVAIEFANETQENITMSEIDIKALVDQVTAGVTEAVSAKLDATTEAVSAVKAELDEIKNAPAVNPAPTAVKASKPAEVKEKPDEFKTLGEQLLAVARKALNPAYDDRRLYTKAPTGLSETVPADGGFLVYPTFAQELWRRTYETGVLWSRTRRIPLGPNSNRLALNAINETSRADGSRLGGVRGYWLEEGGTKTASDPAFRRINLELKKLIGLCYATDELLADANALESVITQGFAEEFGFQLDDKLVNGTGAGVPLGILNAGSLVSVAKETGQAATTVVYENVLKMWARMWARSRGSAVWVINQDVEPQLYTMSLAVGTGGAPVFLPPGGASVMPYATLFGRPVIPVEHCPTLGTVGDIMLLDLSQYITIDKGGMESASSIHVQFLTDQTVFRFVMRVDGQPAWDAALTPYQGTNTQSPFIALATRA